MYWEVSGSMVWIPQVCPSILQDYSDLEFSIFSPFLPFKINSMTLNMSDFYLLLNISFIIGIRALECIEK